MTRIKTSLDQTRDAKVEQWLRDEVAPVYDAMKENPARKLSAKSVFSEARARYARGSVEVPSSTSP